MSINVSFAAEWSKELASLLKRHGYEIVELDNALAFYVTYQLKDPAVAIRKFMDELLPVLIDLPPLSKISVIAEVEQKGRR